MYTEFFSKSPLLALPLVALFTFIVVFASIVVRTFGRRWRDDARAAAALPLADDASQTTTRRDAGPAPSGGMRDE